MNIIDFTHSISENMPIYQGSEQPKLTQTSLYGKDGFKETLLCLSSHTGTHADAPSHLFKGYKTLDSFDVSRFFGKAVVIDCTDVKCGGAIGMDMIAKVGALADEADFLLFHTGWDEYWGSKEYFCNFRCISEEVAKYCVASKKKGVGFDTISIDPADDKLLNLHRIILGTNEMLIIENLTRLGEAGKVLFDFCVLPLKYENSDGAPVRAIGFV